MDLINEGEIGGIIYEVTSPECIDSCTGGYCGCRPCSYYMPGCAECSSSTVCTACELHQYRVNAPPVGGNTCPCMDRFYQNDAGICVPCPLQKNCATCTFNSSSGLPECATCACDQHREVVAPSTDCECMAGFAVASPGDAYCVADAR
mgnify:FL=1